ncbi:hypothetical protein HDU97_008610 [Phlyctochytrium planicorne]|nr:hypothetical protein HDU97_008610 [Phlyctochytrium planicorne]
MLAVRNLFASARRYYASKTLFVGNLSWATTNEDLGDLFSKYGAVTSARIIQERETGRSRGFGFVEMEDDAALAAMEKLNGTTFQGRDIQVREGNAQGPRAPRRERRF